MQLVVNGQPSEVPERASVADLLATLGFAGKPVAVEVNRDVVPRAQHSARLLAAGDSVEIVTLVGGG